MKRFNIYPMNWQKLFRLNEFFLPENDFGNVLTFSQLKMANFKTVSD